MAVEARYFLDGQAQSARFADFVPQEMKYVALIATCPSWNRRESSFPSRPPFAVLHREGETFSRKLVTIAQIAGWRSGKGRLLFLRRQPFQADKTI